MTEKRFASVGAMQAQLTKDVAARQMRIQGALYSVAKLAAAYVRDRTVPVAFTELRDSIHAEETARGARVVADAPHAEFVEVGTRPHTPPIEPILAWVKLRGMQGLESKATLTKRGAGSTTYGHAKYTASLLRAAQMPKNKPGHTSYRKRGTYLPVDAPMQIARAIQFSISKNGTRPHWYMQAGEAKAKELVDAMMPKALED